MNVLSQIFSSGAKNIIDSAGGLIDKITTSDEEKLNAKNELAEIVTKSMSSLQQAQKEIIAGEVSGNWQQRSWRPIIMLSFGFIVIYAYFIEPAFINPNEAEQIASKISPKFWDLLEIGFGGYIIGRSAEKITGSLTKNSDISFFRKKDRKNTFG